jgi:hypothetical protein
MSVVGPERLLVRRSDMSAIGGKPEDANDPKPTCVASGGALHHEDSSLLIAAEK